MIEDLQELTESLGPAVQWLVVMGAGAIPFVESYFGSALGVLAGMPPVVAVAAAVVGNVACVLAVIAVTNRVRARALRPSADAAVVTAAHDTQPAPVSKRRQRSRRAFDRYGVPGVSLVGPVLLPSQVNAAALISFGAPVRSVVAWQVVSIVLWGAGFAALAVWGVDLATG